MHYRQLMTLDIGNDALLCKVFPASLQEQALSWFHRLPPNSVGNFRDLSEAFVGQYLSSNEASVQALHSSNHWLKSLLLRWMTYSGRANKYSMLEDDVRAATQQVLVVGRPSGSNTERNTKPPDRPKPSDQRQEGPSRPEAPPLTPLSISYEKLLPMIQGLSDFKWPKPIATDLSTRDRSRRCAFHKDHGHTTETCRSFQYLVERLIKAGHLKQYLRSDNGGRDAPQHHNPGTLGPQLPPRPS
ncbi:hypothetical protein CK203_115727 [Vitis vinifera]|uniref:Retrotransposon gag domain-containing protein n=1 Tax=Vitis vinifera TaxID=29760 RepID=A0A438C405_VITVI|nr:hypothetical protein CK203_115727 [Vitis vinifera]